MCLFAIERVLLGEEFGLGGDCGRGFAAGYAYYAEDGELGDGGAGDEDAVCVGREVGRSELDAVVEEREKVVRDDAFEGFTVGIAEADPEPVEFGTAEEGFALGFEVTIEFADEIEGANAFEGNLLMSAVGSEEIERVDLAETGRIEVALQGFAVHQGDDNFLMSRGWGAELQSSRFWRSSAIMSGCWAPD
jgi:hypothetical protein